MSSPDPARSSTPRRCADARQALEAFREEFGAQYPKSALQARKRPEAADRVLRLPRRALASSSDDELGRVELRGLKLRTRVTKGAGSKAAALAMAYKLLVSWRRFNGHELIAEVIDGAAFKDGVKVADHEPTTQEEGRRLTLSHAVDPQLLTIALANRRTIGFHFVYITPTEIRP